MPDRCAIELAAACSDVWRAFHGAAGEPGKTQEALLRRILRHNRDTAYGRKQRFDAIRTGDEYARALPVVTATDIAPWIDDMANGRRDVLVAGVPVAFNQTSGTTASPKLVPVTRRGQQSAARSVRRWLSCAVGDHPDIAGHGAFIATAAAAEGATPAGIPYGSASGIIHRSLPAALRRQSVVPVAVSQVHDYDARYYLMARFAFAREVSFLATPNPTTLLRLAEVAEAWGERIVRAIRDGTLGDAATTASLPPTLRRRLTRGLSPDRQRARELEAVIGSHGRLVPRTCWPNLELMACWLGGTVGTQASKLGPAFGPVPVRDIGYIASEGWFTVPIRDGTSAGPLDILETYFEFIPAEDTRSNPETVRCDRLVAGQRYRVAITNWNGLYRYDIGDIVEVQGFHRRVPAVAFIRKSGDMLNITGEKLDANHLLTALAATCAELGIDPPVIKAIPDLVHNRYQILAALRGRISPSRIRDTFIPRFDSHLAEVNIEYAAKRRSGRLAMPCVFPMSDRWERETRAEAVAVGAGDAQFKWRTTAYEWNVSDIRHRQGMVAV